MSGSKDSRGQVTRQRGPGRTGQHFLHVDFALLEEVGKPVAVPQLHQLLQAEQEQREMRSVLQLVGQIVQVDQVGDDCACCKLGQVGLHQRDFLLDVGTLIQNTQNSLLTRTESLDPDGKTPTRDVERDSSETDLHQLLTSDDTLGTERMDQDTRVLLILV